MKKSHLALLFMVLVLVLATWSPAQAAPSITLAKKTTAPTIEITNKTKQKVTVKFTGAGNYTVDAIKAKTVLEVVIGTYQYSYTACGTIKTGTIKVSATKPGKLVIPACKGMKMVAVTIDNKTGGTLYLYLTGPATYNFTFGSGKTKIFIQQGKYSYRAIGCGGATKTGTVKFGGGKNVWTWFCY
jgi:hypothetical protein